MKDTNHKSFHTYIKTYFVPFTITFIAMQFFVFLAFYLKGKTLIWDYDGAYQHFPALSYLSNSIKDIFSGNGFKMFDTSIGLGADVLNTLSYYAIGDPLALLCALAPAKHLEFFYSFFVILRLYLAGVTFSIFCFHKKKEAFPTLLACLAYVFCSYTLYGGLKHPFFLNPMIYLPLLLICIDRLLEAKKGLMLSLMIALCALSNFYFFYMLTIIIFVYALVRFYDVYKTDRVKQFFSVVLRGIFYYLLGLAMSMVLFLPTVFAFLHNGRLSNAPTSLSLWHYAYSYYRKLPNVLFAIGTGSSYWTLLGISVLAVFCAIAVFFGKEKWNSQKTFLVIVAISLLIPIFGKIMNGMSIVSNRWIFALIFLISYLIADHYNDIFDMTERAQTVSLIFVGLYSVYALFLGDKYVRIPTLIMIAMFVLIIRFPYLVMASKQRDRIMLGLVVINIVVSSNLFYQSFGSNFSADFLSYGESDNYTKSAASDELADLNDEFCRMQDAVVQSPNLALTNQMNSSSFYFSLMDDRIYKYMYGLDNASQHFACQFFDFDRRSMLQSLNNVKYFISSSKGNIPFGYKLYKEFTNNDKTNYIYKNEYALPFGYTYDSYITETDYDSLTPLQKQEAMLQSVVLEEESDQISKGQPEYHITELPYTMTAKNESTYENGILSVKAKNTRFKLQYKAPKASEVYIQLNDLDINDSKREKISIHTLTNKKHKNYIPYRGLADRYYFGRTDALINLGYNGRTKNNTRFTITQKGTYKLGSLKIYAQDLKPIKTYYSDLTQNVLENVSFENNKVSGSITLEQPKFLLMSVPYSEGWTAYVDGVKTPLSCANVMYSGLMLPAGSHEIKLVYCTPYLTLGGYISLGALLVFAVLAVISIIYNKKVKKADIEEIKETQLTA